MTYYKQSTGKSGEEMARNYLEEQGYHILGHNLTSPYGEIDVVALKDKNLHFVEIRTRLNDEFGSALESITKQKVLKIRKTASYLKIQNPSWNQYAPYFSVIAIDQKDGVNHLEFLPDAF